jgi:putative transposase
VTAKRPNHVWHVDLTTVPTAAGFWTTWLPLALPQCWPFCWWVAVAVDHFSRRVMGVAVFARQPTSLAVRTFLGRTIAKAGTALKYIICDRGSQFDCDAFRHWCRRSGIKPPRYGAIGQHGSIAVVERFILTLKTGCTRSLLVPYCRESFLRELRLFGEWYNEARPHSRLGGKTPGESYGGKNPANRSPRFKPRSRWARGSPCARPQALIKGQPGIHLELKVTFYKGRRHLPVVKLTRAA